MPLPINLILVRHGQSEGNVATEASKHGDDSYFTEEFRGRHSRDFRLTDKGIKQAVAAGEWIRKNIRDNFDGFYVSDYIRAKETAALLDLAFANWRVEFHLRERDRALIDNVPRSEERELFPLEHKQYKINPFYSVPAGGGESFASFCLRLKAMFIEHLSRRSNDFAVIAVCHGHVMRALQMEIENLEHDDFLRLDSSKDPTDKIDNCQIFWYTRIDPNTGDVGKKIIAVRSISPWGDVFDSGWRRIVPKFSSNEDLLEEVSRYPRIVNG